MNLLPVIQREIREQSRQAITHWLRSAVAAVMTLVAAYILLQGFDVNARGGSRLFGIFHTALLLIIWVLVPASVADTISSERRNGTLGLLFLTPLKARDIVFAKAFAHGTRLAALALAVVPVLALSFLVGGVGWWEITLSVVINGTSLMLAVAAGILASSFCRNFSHALAASAVLCAGVAAVGAFTKTVGFIAVLFWGTTRQWPSLEDIAIGCVMYAGDAHGFWSDVQTNIAVVMHRWLIEEVASSVVLAAVSGWLLWLTSVRVKRCWRESPPPLWMQTVERKLTKPVLAVPFYQRFMRWLLEGNPVGWLEWRRWHGRLVSWVWLAIVIGVAIAMLQPENMTGWLRNPMFSFQGLSTLLLLGIGVSVAGSFRRERENGLLELMVVSPLTARQIIWGRLRGVWGQFLPAVVCLVLLWMYLLQLSPYSSMGISGLLSTAWLVGSYATLPVIGLYFSLRCRNFMVALSLTILVGLGVPGIVSRLLYGSAQAAGWDARVLGAILMIDALFRVWVALICFGLMHANLRSGTFLTAVAPNAGLRQA